MELSDAAHHALDLLSKRSKYHQPGYGWYKINFTEVGYICLICGQNLPHDTVRKHGLQHLKEHHLLAFL